MRARRDAKAREATELNNKYPADQRMPAADAEKLDTVLNEIEAIDAEIARENRLNQIAGDEQAEHEHALNQATRAGGGQTDESAALRAMLTGGLSALTQEQRQAMASRQNPDIRQAMSTTTGTEGGYTVATEFSRNLLQAMRQMGGVRSVASNIKTATGAQMLFPTADSTAEEGEIVGQNQQVGKGETTFGQASMDVYKYSSKAIALPFELIQDSMFDVEAYIQELLKLRLWRIQNRHQTMGSGTSQPKGLVTAATLGKAGATGQVASVTYDDLVDLEHSVDPVYRSACRLMMHDDILRAVRKIKDSNNRPIFVPGYEQGNPGGAPDRLLGREIVINQNMDPMGAGKKSILFGDFSKYVVRDVMDLTLFRMADSKYIESGQIGFLAFMRSGGNLLDVGGAVKYYQNAAS
ncbi:phage major capsid protein [Chromobacterium haemolyticum]|uniref:phage major capsid protein n=1 Tax=Chromobacterium haemolyticum TaxID=394935 RepID=UPI0005857B80